MPATKEAIRKILTGTLAGLNLCRLVIDSSADPELRRAARETESLLWKASSGLNVVHAERIGSQEHAHE